MRYQPFNRTRLSTIRVRITIITLALLLGREREEHGDRDGERRLWRLHGEIRAAASTVSAAAPAARPHLRHQGHACVFSFSSFDISGRVTGFGNPDWARTHAPAAATSPVVLVTLAAGATSVGKTVMDEMAYRPSHGLVSTENVIPMSQMFDTVGWFARDLSTLSRVGNVLLPLPAENSINQPTHFTIPQDCFEILGSLKDQTYQILNASVSKRFGSDAVDNRNLGEFVSNNVPSIGKFISDFSKSEAPSVPHLSVISYVMRCLQRFLLQLIWTNLNIVNQYDFSTHLLVLPILSEEVKNVNVFFRSEFKANHAEWVSTVKPNLGPGIRERVYEAITSEDGPMEDFHALRTEFKSALADLVKDDGILAIPTVPGSPPKLRMEAAALENFRARAFSLLSIAGLSGFCQLTIPLGVREGVPVSVSLVARHGADRFLISVAQELYETLKEETKKAWSPSNSSL
ncbi:hypothetical protein HU200_009730 [Digitaria exilis]|uniref:Amidase domain-containing protein n=1 Tax=Digitaria exilis TaxID=1010633 RepID=A0A835FKC8_9POAL|nr:hypothetical protein HU200_009730 [Digitaria exilis]